MTLPLNLQKSIDEIINASKKGVVNYDLLENFYDYFECDGYDYLTEICNTDFSIFLYDEIMEDFNDENAKIKLIIPINQVVSNNDRLELVHQIMDDELSDSIYSHPLLHSYKLKSSNQEVYLCCVNYSNSDIVWYGIFREKNDFLNAVKKDNIWAIRAGHAPNLSEILEIWNY